MQWAASSTSFEFRTYKFSIDCRQKPHTIGAHALHVNSWASKVTCCLLLCQHFRSVSTLHELPPIPPLVRRFDHGSRDLLATLA